jgi:hypothetical protein
MGRRRCSRSGRRGSRHLGVVSVDWKREVGRSAYGRSVGIRDSCRVLVLISLCRSVVFYRLTMSKLVSSQSGPSEVNIRIITCLVRDNIDSVGATHLVLAYLHPVTPFLIGITIIAQCSKSTECLLIVVNLKSISTHFRIPHLSPTNTTEDGLSLRENRVSIRSFFEFKVGSAFEACRRHLTFPS